MTTFRLTHLINAFLGILTLGIALTIIIIKSSIANDIKRINQITTHLDEATAHQNALHAEWARLQHRSHLLTLGQARFGNSISEIAEDISVRDLPLRSSDATSQNTALDLFHGARADQASWSSPEPSLFPKDFISALIAQDLETR